MPDKMRVRNIVNKTGTGLTGQKGRQATTAAARISSIIRKLRRKTQAAARRRGFVETELLRANLSPELPRLLAGDEGKRIGIAIGSLPLDGWQISGTAQCGRIVECHLRQAAVLRTSNVGNPGETNFLRDVLVVVLLKSGSRLLVVAKAKFICLQRRKDMRFAGGQTVCVQLLNPGEKAPSISEARQREEIVSGLYSC